ncbi:MAG: pilus assembly protein [Sphingomonas sp.]|nr:pilus assembly protein [Sphingomonas sp.]
MRRAARRLIRLRVCTSGLALTEFAFSLPILLGLGLLGLESANFAMAHLRVSNIAMMTADNAARVRESIDEADVIELLLGAKMSGSGIQFGQNGRIILSSLEINPGGTGQWIRWQRCDGLRSTASRYGGEGTGQNNASLQSVGPPTNPIAAQPGTAVMMVEVVYNYQPIIPNSFLEGRQIRYESAFNVRQRNDQAMKNVGNIPAGQRRTCNLFQA